MGVLLHITFHVNVLCIGFFEPHRIISKWSYVVPCQPSANKKAGNALLLSGWLLFFGVNKIFQLKFMWLYKIDIYGHTPPPLESANRVILVGRV